MKNYFNVYIFIFIILLFSQSYAQEYRPMQVDENSINLINDLIDTYGKHKVLYQIIGDDNNTLHVNIKNKLRPSPYPLSRTNKKYIDAYSIYYDAKQNNISMYTLSKLLEEQYPEALKQKRLRQEQEKNEQIKQQQEEERLEQLRQETNQLLKTIKKEAYDYASRNDEIKLVKQYLSNGSYEEAYNKANDIINKQDTLREEEQKEKERIAELEKERLEQVLKRLERERQAKLEKERLENELEIQRLKEERLKKEQQNKVKEEVFKLLINIEKEAYDYPSRNNDMTLVRQYLSNSEYDKANDTAQLIYIKQINLKTQEKLTQEKKAQLERERVEKERLARLERERVEKERLARLERERVEKERLAKLEREKIERERLAKLERERIERERLARLERERVEKISIGILIVILTLSFLIGFWNKLVRVFNWLKSSLIILWKRIVNFLKSLLKILWIKIVRSFHWLKSILIILWYKLVYPFSNVKLFIIILWKKLKQKQQTKLERERLEKERLERERLAKLELARLERERLARLERERVEKEVQAIVKQERLKQAKRDKFKKIFTNLISKFQHLNISKNSFANIIFSKSGVIVFLFCMIFIFGITINFFSSNNTNDVDKATLSEPKEINAVDIKSNDEAQTNPEKNIEDCIITANDSFDIIQKKKMILKKRMSLILFNCVLNRNNEDIKLKEESIRYYNNFIAAICDWTCSLNTKKEILNMYYDMASRVMKNIDDDEFKAFLIKGIVDAESKIDAPYDAELLRKAQEEDSTVMLLQKDGDFTYFISKMYSSGFDSSQNYVKVKILNNSYQYCLFSKIYIRFFNDGELLDEGVLHVNLQLPLGKSTTVLIKMKDINKSTPEWYHAHANDIYVSIEGNCSNGSYSVIMEDLLHK